MRAWGGVGQTGRAAAMSVAGNTSEAAEAAPLPFVEMAQQDRPSTPSQVLPCKVPRGAPFQINLEPTPCTFWLGGIW